MNRIFRIYRLIFLVLAVALLAGDAAWAQIGFKGEFYTPTTFVSPYDRQPDELSVALYPKTYPLILKNLRLSPNPVYSSYAGNYIRFETVYYKNRYNKWELIPIAVDAQSFSDYLRRRNVRESFGEISMTTLEDKRKKRGGGGLGISLALPKRLDKIFGEGGAGLKVSGYRKITFAGRSTWTDQAESETYRQSKFPSLRMEQISRFDITGTIGSKISVKVSQDSQTDIPLANRIQIRYKGDEDDILKSIEAGNTTLSLPNTQFVGYSSSIRGLFGLKAEAQVGNLTLTAIASQEKGSTERASFSASGEESAQIYRDHEYVKRLIFDLGQPEEFSAGDTILDLQIFESISSSTTDLEATPANFYVDPDNKAFNEFENITGYSENVKSLEGSYVFYDDPEENKHFVVFNSYRNPNYNLGYWAVIQRQGGGVDTVGSLIIDDTHPGYELRLLAPKETNAQPIQATWKLMWRNCYPIPKTATIETIDVKVFEGVDGSENTSSSFDFMEDENGTRFYYLEVFGLDRYNKATGQRVSDNILDDREYIFRPDWGVVIFPSRTPFDDDVTFTDANGKTTPVIPEDKRVPTIYEYTSPTERTEKSNFYLKIFSTNTRQSIIKLNRANIIEGSESVKVNGRELTKGQDYTIQYDFGQITLLDEEALDANADISIDYDYAPFFSVQKKSLFGIRGEYEWSKDFRFGSTFLYKSDKAQDRKPKVGQETARTLIYDADMSLKLHPNFLTTAVNALPLVESTLPSNLQIAAEVAQSHPNPNVNNEAFIDDFETAQEELSLGITRTTWKEASVPFPVDTNEYGRGKLLWHNPRELTDVEEIYDKDTRAGEGSIRTFRMIFDPKVNVDEGGTIPTHSWGGIMRYFGNRVDSKRAQLFEVRTKAKRGIVHFDFGKVSVDVNGNGKPDTEDLDNNKAVTETEDVGLDGLPDELEPGYDPITNPDPNGDNWYFLGDGKCPLPGDCDALDWDNDTLYYKYLNGTEGNIRDPGVNGIPDREVQPGSPGFSTNEAYYTYTLDFSSDSFRVETSGKPVPGTDETWWTYRIPIRDPDIDSTIASSIELVPDWSQITYVRVWMESDDPINGVPDTIEIADWGFVQSNWQDTILFHSPEEKSAFVVASVSEDVDTLFQPPPGVEGYKDPATGIIEPQKALLMKFENLHHLDSCLATKDLITVDKYSGYRKLEMYVYGDIDEADAGDVKFFFRLGKDETNYYEAFTYVYPEWDDRNNINIDFNDLTALKDSAQRVEGTNVDLNVSNDKYAVVGRPNINEIRYFAAGVVNTDTTRTLNGAVWLDELRVTEVRKDVGTAGRFSINGNLADLLTYNFQFTSQDPYFRGISATTRGGSSENLGSGRTSTRYSYSVTLNLNKFLPRSWNARLPVSYSYSKSIETPLLRTNSDIVLPDEIRQEEQTINESKGVTVSAQFKKQGRNPLFTVFLNRLKTRFSYRRQNHKSVNYPYKLGENIDVNADYDLGVSKPPSLAIFFWTKWIPIVKKISDDRLTLYPDTWKTTARFNRSVTVIDDLNLERSSTIKRDFTGNMQMNYKPFENLTTSLTYDTRRDLSDLDQVNITLKNFKDFKLGLETHYGQRFNASYDPKLLEFLTASFGYRSNYTEDWDRNTESRRSSMSRTWSVGGDFNHLQFLGGQGGRKKRGPVRAADRRRGTRTSKEEREKLEERNKHFYDPVVKLIAGVLRKLTGWVDPVKYSYNESYNNAVSGLLSRPSLGYRFGLNDDPDVERTQDNRPQVSAEGNGYELGSGFNLFGGLDTQVKFRESVTRDLIKQGKRYENTSTSWPDLTLRISRFKNLPLIQGPVNKFIDVFAPRTGYSRQVKESRDIDVGFISSKSISIRYNPLISINFKLFRSLSMSASYSLSEDNRKNYNTVTQTLQTETNSTQSGFSLSSNYSFSSPYGISIPFFGKLKFKSTVDLRLQVKMNKSITETSTNGGAFVTSADKSDFSVSPVIAYTFSRQIKGGLTVRWQDTKDNHRGRNTHVREVQLWTEIRF